MPTRKEILEMLSAGEIDVTRATELLSGAREDDPSARASAPEIPPVPAPPPAPDAPRAPQAPGSAARRWLHIHVSDLETGKNRVRVNVPLGLVDFGLKVGASFTDEVDSEMIQGVMDALRDDELTGTLVEVEDVDDNERVHIFID
jgi:hypothetical protein